MNILRNSPNVAKRSCNQYLFSTTLLGPECPKVSHAYTHSHRVPIESGRHACYHWLWSWLTEDREHSQRTPEPLPGSLPLRGQWTCDGSAWRETFLSSRSVELNGFVAFRDQYMGMSVPPHYQYIPHLFSYSAHSPLLPPQARSLDPQSYSLIHQLVSAEDLEPLGTPMLIEDGWVSLAVFSPAASMWPLPHTHLHPRLL